MYEMIETVEFLFGTVSHLSLSFSFRFQSTSRISSSSIVSDKPEEELQMTAILKLSTIWEQNWKFAVKNTFLLPLMFNFS